MLDTNAIVSQLVALERIPIQLIESQKGQQQDKLDKINQLADLVKGLQDKAEGLSSLDEFYAFSVGGSFEGSLTVSAGAGAVAGTHTVEVLSTSGTDRWSFDGVADSTSNLAAGAGETVDFTVNGTTYQITVDAAASSLDAIASQINDENRGRRHRHGREHGHRGGWSYKLLLASDHQGEDGRITGIASTVAGLTIEDARGQRQRRQLEPRVGGDECGGRHRWPDDPAHHERLQRRPAAPSVLAETTRR